MSGPSKRGFTLRLSEEMAAEADGFEQLGHFEPAAPAPADVAAHARARALLSEVESNPFIRVSFDGELVVEDLEGEVWVPDETHEEYLARWRASRGVVR